MRDVNMIGYRCDVEGIIAQATSGSSSGSSSGSAT